jgi:hypothetical protein
MTWRWLDKDLIMTWRWHWPWHDQWYDNTMLARIRIYSMLSNNTMHKCIDFMLVYDHKFVPSTNCLRRLKSYIPEGRHSAFSKKNPKVLLKSISISHELHPRGGGSNSVFYENTQSTSENHIYENLFWLYLKTTGRILLQCSVTF